MYASGDESGAGMPLGEVPSANERPATAVSFQQFDPALVVDPLPDWEYFDLVAPSGSLSPQQINGHKSKLSNYSSTERTSLA